MPEVDNRYYSSTLARFTTPDPYRASGGPADPQSWNRYAYVQNDPVNFNDPSGLIRHCPPGTVPAGSGFSMYCAPLYREAPRGGGGGGTGFENPNIAQLLALDGSEYVGGGGGSPAPPPVDQCSATFLADSMKTTRAFDAQGNAVTARPLAGFADDIVKWAGEYGIDPRILVAISFVESKWGADAPAARTQNAFGLMRHNALIDYSDIGGWSTGIKAAAQTIQKFQNLGVDTIEGLYSGIRQGPGSPGAYCVGPGCADKQAILKDHLDRMGLSGTSTRSSCP